MIQSSQIGKRGVNNYPVSFLLFRSIGQKITDGIAWLYLLFMTRPHALKNDWYEICFYYVPNEHLLLLFMLKTCYHFLLQVCKRTRYSKMSGFDMLWCYVKRSLFPHYTTSAFFPCQQRWFQSFLWGRICTCENHILLD